MLLRQHPQASAPEKKRLRKGRDMSVELPNYVEYGPRETAPPPFEAGAGAFAGVILRGDMRTIESLCERVLNEPFEKPGPPSWRFGPFGFGRPPASPWVFKPF